VLPSYNGFILFSYRQEYKARNKEAGAVSLYLKPNNSKGEEET
jgi:hypothetical protein